MKIESFVEEILDLLVKAQNEESDCEDEVQDYVDKISVIVKKLSKMKQLQGKDKKKQVYLNYWKVTQALAEMGLEQILEHTDNWEREVGLSLLVHCTNNSASIRRICNKREMFYNNLFMCIYDERIHCELDTATEEVLNFLTIAYRMLLMGRYKDIQSLLEFREYDPKQNIIGEIFSIIHDIAINAIMCFNLYEELPVQILIYCMKIVLFVSETGSPSDLEKLRILHKEYIFICNALSEFLTTGECQNAKLMLLTFPILGQFVQMAGEFNKIMNSKVYSKKPETKSKCERLAIMEFRGDYFVFCSSPECRKVAYADRKFRHCARCMLARYCSNKCQLYHWANGHKKYCISVSA